MSRWERLKYSMVRPDDDPKEVVKQEDRPLAEIQEDIRRSNDKERTIGLVAAPIAAIIGIFIGSASLNYAKTNHLSTHVYTELIYVLLGMSVLILVTSMLRKRLFQGITLALYGLACFQLHYTYIGFAAPFILAGAWYLVRAWRLQQELKRVEMAGGGRSAPRASGSGTKPARPRPNKRYTPPT